MPFRTRLGGAAGASSTLGEFFRLCDAAGSDCTFGPNSQARYEALTQRLLQSPVVLQDPSGTIRVTYVSLVGTTSNVLYATAAWPDFADYLAALEAAASAADIRQRVA